MSVRDRMSRRVTTVRPEARLSEAALLMRTRKIRHLPVVDRAGRLVGMVTARDLRQALFAPAVQSETEDVLGLLETLAVGDVMTRSVLSVRAATSIRDAARLMHERKLGALPVVERERLIGLLTETDVLRAFEELLGPTRATAITP
jgi:acetoin utilization protein AcuB